MNAGVLSRLAVLRRPRAALIATGLIAGSTAWAALPAAAAGSCATSSPSSNAYSATVCITAPAAGATVTGSTSVTATVSVTGTNPGVRELVFTLDNGALVWDFQSPFAWTLDSARWVDGSYTVRVSAIMRDGFNTSITAQTVTFSNGNSTPPVNNSSFTPTAGTTPPPDTRLS